MNWTDLVADETRLLQKHFTPGRAGKTIDKIVLHHNAGTLTIEDCWNVWQTRVASAHYQVETSGRIGQLVNDWDTAWHAGDWETNLTSIGIEHANNTKAPTWTISEATLDAGAHLVAALCHAYKLGRPEWGRNVFGHQNFFPTSCPGAIAGPQRAPYMTRAQAYYDGTYPPAQPTKEPETTVAQLTQAQVDQLLADVHTIAQSVTRGEAGVRGAGDVILWLDKLATAQKKTTTDPN